MSNIVEVFGQFAIQVEGNTKMFATRQEAEGAAILAEREAEFVSAASAYTDSLDNITSPKQAKMHQNVIVGFLAWQAGQVEDTVDGTEI